jgi:hypothetical protein
MNTKEKLELLWKYLLLIIIAVTLFRFSGKPHFKMISKHLDHGNNEIFFYGGDKHEMDVNVEHEIVNGDTIIKVMLNGEEIDISNFNEKDGKMKWVSKDGEIIVIDIDDGLSGENIEKDVRIIRKKIIIDDDK